MQSSQIMVILAWLRNINGEGQQSGALPQMIINTTQWKQINLLWSKWMGAVGADCYTTMPHYFCWVMNLT